MVKWMDEKKLFKEVNRSIQEVWPSVFVHDNIPHTLENMITYGFQHIGLGAGLCSSVKVQNEEDGSIIVIMEHKFGIKWSRIVAEAFSDAIKKLLNVPVETRVLPSTVVIKARER